MTLLLKLVLMLLTGLLATQFPAGGVHAGEIDLWGTPLRWSGYGTLGYSGDNDDRLTLIRELSQEPRNGFSTGSSWRPDTRLGLHLDYHPTASTELVAQAVLRDQATQNTNTILELAYAGVALGPHWRIRGGRVGFDPFLMSDYRNLGFAYVWTRPPPEYYSWMPIFSVDGLDVIAEITDGDGGLWRMRGQAGISTPMLVIGNQAFTVQVRDLYGLSLTRETFLWRLKLGYTQYRTTNDPPTLAPLITGLGQVAAGAPPGIADEAQLLREQIQIDGARQDFLSFGGVYDDGSWITQFEIGRVGANRDILMSSEMGYLMLGHRVGHWTPFVTGAFANRSRALRAPVNDWDAIGLGGLQDVAISVANSTYSDQRSLTLGLRWDLHPSAALTAQVARVEIKPDGYALWWRQPQINSERTLVTTFGLALDFLF